MAKIHMTTRRKQSQLIAIGTDHRGYHLKEYLITALREVGHNVIDLGAHSTVPVDYPDIAKKVTQLVTDRGARGILICSTGVGMDIAANKVRGIRAGIAWTVDVAVRGRREDDTNVVCIPNDLLTRKQVYAIVRAWLHTSFGKELRYTRRRRKIQSLEDAWTQRKK